MTNAANDDASGGDTTCDSTVYRFHDDFRTTQGYRGWYYAYSASNTLFPSCTNGRWNKGTQFPFIDHVADPNNAGVMGMRLHPGDREGGAANRDDSQVRVRWLAPVTGFIRIYGYMQDKNDAQGDGQYGDIKKAGNRIWGRQYMSDNDIPYPFDVSRAINAGEYVDFIVDRGANGDHYGDGTFVDATIAYIHP
jgi:hypothetical protein